MTPSRTNGWTIAAVALTALLSGCGLHGKPTVERKPDPHRESQRSGPSDRGPAAAQGASGEPGSVVAPGIVEPWGGEVELSAQEPGSIARVVAREGESVEAGQLLAVLEDGGQRHAVELAAAEVAEAEAALARAENGSTTEELRQAEAEQAAAAARARLARSAADRAQRLHQGGAVPDAEADRAAAEAQALAALAERADARLLELRRGTRPEDRSAARARAASARARLRLAEAALARRRVTAPSAGVVLRSRFHAGEYYAPGAGPLVVLGDMSRLQIRLEVDEIDSGDVQVDAPCALHSDGQVRLAEGTVARIAPKMGRKALPIESPTARSDVRVREVFVEVPAATRLVPGQRVWGHVARVRTAQGRTATSPRGG